MPAKRIEAKTSLTAAWICFCRAISALERNECYHSDDRIALTLLPGFWRLLLRIPYAGRLLLRIFTARGIYEYVIARTKYIDAVFREALAERFSQILLFGAGFDTRALRFQSEAGQTTIYELDAPVTLVPDVSRHVIVPGNAPSRVSKADALHMPLEKHLALLGRGRCVRHGEAPSYVSSSRR